MSTAHLVGTAFLALVLRKQAYEQTARGIRHELDGELLDRFLRLMEGTAPYQASLDGVRSIEGPIPGRIILNFAPKSFVTVHGVREQATVGLATFTDATDEAGFVRSDPDSGNTALAAGDVDGDGIDEIFLAGRLYRVQGGFVRDVTASSGIAVTPGNAHAVFADGQGHWMAFAAWTNPNQVTEATGGMIQVRALVSAADAPTLWDLRCLVRERLVAWVFEHRRDSLPRLRADVAQGERASAASLRQRRTAAGTSPRTTTSETAKRPPGFSTRNASFSTVRLSPDRLMTQLEMMTSTLASERLSWK